MSPSISRHSCFVFGRSWVLIKGSALAILTGCFHGSLQSVRRHWPDIVVSSVTGQRDELLLSRGLNSGRTRQFSLLQNTQTVSRAPPPPPHTVQWILASLDPVDKQPGLEAAHSPSYSAQLNNNSTPFDFMAGTGKTLLLSLYCYYLSLTSTDCVSIYGCLAQTFQLCEIAFCFNRAKVNRYVHTLLFEDR